MPISSNRSFHMDQKAQPEVESERGGAAAAQARPMSGRAPTLMNSPCIGMGNLPLTAPPDHSQQLTDTVRRDTYPVPECRVRVAEESQSSVSMRSHVTEPAQSKPTTHTYKVHCPTIPLSIIPLTARESRRPVRCHEPVAKQDPSHCFESPSPESCRETVERPNRSRTFLKAG